MTSTLTVGLTELHGIAAETMANPPGGIHYVTAESTSSLIDHVIRSSAKGVLHRFDGRECDLLEAPLFPIRTRAPWIFTPAGLAGAATFNLMGVPLPRSVRVGYLRHLMVQPNFKRLIFKSTAGSRTLRNYARLNDARIDAKTSVIYPAIGRVEEAAIRYSKTGTRFLFAGEFFRKGGANVVDAFERLQRERDDITLRVCSGDHDFVNGPEGLGDQYRERMRRNDAIQVGSVPREAMMSSIYPESDVLVSPTMSESFGYALLEASAYGLPVISTRLNAIPEIVEHEKSGFLIDVEHFDFVKRGRYGPLPRIDAAYHAHVSDLTHLHMQRFAAERSLVERMGRFGVELARTRFSFEKRNSSLQRIYQEAVN